MRKARATGPAPRASRRAVAVVLALVASRPVVASAAEEPRSFDELFIQGVQQSELGDSLAAARSWTEASKLLPPDDRDNRRSLYGDIAEAYEKALDRAVDRAILEEAVQVLDRYVQDFAAAFPGESLEPRGTQVHERLRARLAASARPPEPAPVRPPVVVEPREVTPPEPPPAAPPVRSPPDRLRIAGGVTLGLGGVMLALFVEGVIVSVAREREFDDPDNHCFLNQPAGRCASLLAGGRRANAAAVVGLVTAPILLATGGALLGVARRDKGRRALAPVVGPTTAGVVWRLRF